LICPAERRKLAKQPEALSAEELKSLLILTRERFLDRFDALIPKTTLRHTDKIKASCMLNGKYLNFALFVCISSMVLLFIILVKLTEDVFVKSKCIL
jgi:hypothetical protein